MEHPFHVDKFRPSDATPTPATEEKIAPPLAEAALTPLPPLPNLPPSDVEFLRPSDPRYADFLAAASKRKQLAPALRAICKTQLAVAAGRRRARSRRRRPRRFSWQGCGFDGDEAGREM